MKNYLLSKHYLKSLFTLIVLAQASVLAQPSIQWDKTFGGESNDNLAVAVQTPDGGYILGGTSDSFISGDKSEDSDNFSLWIVKTNSRGEKEWDKTIGSGEIYLVSIILTNDGGYLLGGGRGDYGTFLIKTDKNGLTQWQKSFQRGESPKLGSMQKTSDGGYIIGFTSHLGEEESQGQEPRSSDYWIVKIDANGIIQWDKVYGGADADQLTFIEVTSDNGYIITGYSNSGKSFDKSEESRGNSDLWILKLDMSGNKQWDKTIGGPGLETEGVIRQTTDGGYILGATSVSSAGGDKSVDSFGSDYWVVKLYATGQVQWDKSISGGTVSSGGIYDERFTTIIQTSDGGFLAGGSSGSSAGMNKTQGNKGQPDMWIVKLTANGIQEWDKTIGTTEYDFLRSLIQTSDGGYLLGTGSPSNTNGDKTQNSKGVTDFWIVKLAPEPLPVTLTYFIAQKENTTALLNWSTSSETHSDRFEVQHSLNGKTWDLIANVKANGDVNKPANYMLIDNKPVLGIDNLYRLKMIDTDGTFTYSKIESLHFDGDATLNIYPNPASEVLNIEMADWHKVKSVELLNSRSNVVYHSGDKPVQSVNVKELPTGIYFLRIGLIGGNSLVRKVLVESK